MADPANILEYNERLRNNIRLDRAGPSAVLHQPCPFCAAPDFFWASMSAVAATWLIGSNCAECGRGAKGVFVAAPGGVNMEIVQTKGSDQPTWLNPRMRREREVLGD